MSKYDKIIVIASDSKHYDQFMEYDKYIQRYLTMCGPPWVAAPATATEAQMNENIMRKKLRL
jgi:hypothetical protein